MPTDDALNDLNSASRATARRMLEPLVERSSWVAEVVVDRRPFATDQDVALALIDVILGAGFDKRVALFRAHPELAGREAADGTMTEASTSEQGRLGLTALGPGDAARLSHLNAAYLARFGYPFILALHRVPDLETVFGLFERRLAAPPAEEHVATLAEIASVIGARAARAFGGRPGGGPRSGSGPRPGAGRPGLEGSEAADG